MTFEDNTYEIFQGGKNMRFIAKTRCPECGRTAIHHLTASNFVGKEITDCECGCRYYNIEQLQSCEIDEEGYRIERLSAFTTEQLEAEIKRRNELKEKRLRK